MRSRSKQLSQLLETATPQQRDAIEIALSPDGTIEEMARCLDSRRAAVDLYAQVAAIVFALEENDTTCELCGRAQADRVRRAMWRCVVDRKIARDAWYTAWALCLLALIPWIPGDARRSLFAGHAREFATHHRVCKRCVWHCRWRMGLAIILSLASKLVLIPVGILAVLLIILNTIAVFSHPADLKYFLIPCVIACVVAIIAWLLAAQSLHWIALPKAWRSIRRNPFRFIGTESGGSTQQSHAGHTS